YAFSLGGKNRFTVYAAPGDEIVTEVIALDPINVRTSGTPLYSGINEVNQLVDPIKDKYTLLSRQENPPREEMNALLDDYDQTLKDFILENPTNQSSVYALLELQGEDFLEYFNKISEGAKTSILYPVAELKRKSVEKRAEMDRRQKEMAAGDKMAPDFTLLNLQDKEVSLSDFRGKWVILDFWGSWCIWCIKGFPELKEAYEKYKDKLEIVGVDCNESVDAWRAGVKKYELPWVNVYNPPTTTLLEEYGVQGFPTKAIIDPEGKILNITTGHKPDFFITLSNLIEGK
ncbi:MAG: TlpA family protein disulfide reductase, partial [Muribaculaceae bacterium]|nr:TlpA family protein disulfide reductase [Muribaculaceae bacterium]